MRRLLALAAFAAVAVPAGAQAPAPAEDAPALLRRSVVAHGGADLIAKFPAAKVKIKGCMQVPFQPKPVDFTALVTYQMPDRFKQVFTINMGGQPQTFKQVIEGDKVRQSVAGQEIPLSEADAAKLRFAMYVQNLYRLTPLSDTKVYRLGLVDDVMVCERPARGVRVSADGRKDVTLYFDRGTGLLVRAVRPATDLLGKEVMMEETFMNYKDVRGYLYPTKSQVLLNGVKHVESEVVEFLPLEQFDPSEFALP